MPRYNITMLINGMVDDEGTTMDIATAEQAIVKHATEWGDNPNDISYMMASVTVNGKLRKYHPSRDGFYEIEQVIS